MSWLALLPSALLGKPTAAGSGREPQHLGLQCCVKCSWFQEGSLGPVAHIQGERIVKDMNTHRLTTVHLLAPKIHVPVTCKMHSVLPKGPPKSVPVMSLALSADFHHLNQAQV